jgi:hypothetical protein
MNGKTPTDGYPDRFLHGRVARQVALATEPRLLHETATRSLDVVQNATLNLDNTATGTVDIELEVRLVNTETEQERLNAGLRFRLTENERLVIPGNRFHLAPGSMLQPNTKVTIQKTQSSGTNVVATAAYGSFARYFAPDVAANLS